MNKRLYPLVALLVAFVGTAQENSTIITYSSSSVRYDADPCVRHPLGKPGIFNQLDLALNLGTTGLGLEVATPVTEWVKLRAGFDFTPHIRVPMHFGLQAYRMGNGTIDAGNFGKIQELMNGLTGYDIDDVVDVDGRPTLANFKFLVDVYPFARNRHWHFTAGFYAGNRRVGKAVNTMGEMPSLLAVGLYNRAYEYIMETDFIEEPIYNDIYLSPDAAEQLKEMAEREGRLGVHMGDYPDGTPYMLEPDKDGMVKANAYVNAFKPYVGFGYGGAMSADKRWNISFDAGAMFWGGAPKVVTHEGVEMNQLSNVPGKVGTYLKLIKTMKVYPVVALRISYTFF